MSLLEDLPDDVESDDSSHENFMGLEILPTDDPTTQDWHFGTLYKESQNLGTLTWQIGYISTKGEPYLLIMHGYAFGKINYDHIIVSLNDSGRNHQEQALLQARKRYTDKVRDYYHVGADVNTRSLQPQLANAYLEGGNIKHQHLIRGIICQPKIDGIRAIIYRTDHGVKISSRKGVEFPWLDHIKSDIESLLLFIPDQCGLDTELYSTELNFESITSAIKTRISKSDLNIKIKCYIFDILQPRVILEERIRTLKSAYDLWVKDKHETSIILVDNHKVHTHADIELLHDKYLSDGYEGLMIRKCLGKKMESATRVEIEETWYKGSRNNNLLKYKKFKEDEGVITSVHEGTGRESGLAIFTIRTSDGKLFDCRPSSTFEQRKYWWENPLLCLGQTYTYKYFELTEAGIPRFPVGKGFRDYE